MKMRIRMEMEMVGRVVWSVPGKKEGGSNENGQRTLFGAVQRMWLMCRGMRDEEVEEETVETADD